MKAAGSNLTKPSLPKVIPKVKSYEPSSILRALLTELASCQGKLRIGLQAEVPTQNVRSILKKLERIVESKQVAIDTETYGLYAAALAFAYSLCDEDGNSVTLYKTKEKVGCLACYGSGSGLTAKSLRIPQLWRVQDCKLCDGSGQATLENVWRWVVKRICEDASVVKLFHHRKFDEQRLNNEGIRIAGTAHDTMLMHYVLDSRRPHGLKELSQTRCGLDISDETEVLLWLSAARKAAATSIRRWGYYYLDGQIELNPDRIAYQHIPRSLVDSYARLDAERTQYLFAYARGPIQKKGYLDNYLMEMKLSKVVTKMEQIGMRWDMKMSYRLLDIIKRDAIDFKKETFKHAGREFNILSPKQLATILFGDLGIAVMARTAKGNPRTDKDNLVRYDHPLVTQVLRYRMVRKMDGFVRKYIRSTTREKEGWIIHANILQHGTITTRFSIVDPPLQTTPAMDTGRRSHYIVNIRKCFIPRRGKIVYLLDFSQIEIKLFAVFANEQAMLKAIASGRDIHAEVATEVTGIKPEDEREFAHCRKMAKMVNFALIFGAGESKIAQVLSYEVKNANYDVMGFYDGYHRRFPGVRRFMEKVTRKARDDGYVTTDFGMRIPVDHDTPYKAVNYKIQGTAAGVLKRSIIAASKVAESYKGYTLHTMHDEIIFEMPEEIDHTKSLPEIVNSMEVWKSRFGIPLKVDKAITLTSWADETKVEDLRASTIRRSIAEALRVRDIPRSKADQIRDLRLVR